VVCEDCVKMMKRSSPVFKERLAFSELLVVALVQWRLVGAAGEIGGVGSLIGNLLRN